MLAKPRDITLATAFFFVWLVPITYTGLTKSVVPHANIYMNHMYRVACLFTTRVRSWTHYYIQVKLEDQEDWTSVPTSDYAKLEPFGHRTRFDPMFGYSYKSSAGTLRRLKMAEFIKKRYEALYPEDADIASVRFMRVTIRSGDPRIAKPKGHWVKPPLESFPEKEHIFVFSHDFKTGKTA